jgi:hypothetical protein
MSFIRHCTLCVFPNYLGLITVVVFNQRLSMSARMVLQGNPARGIAAQLELRPIRTGRHVAACPTIKVYRSSIRITTCCHPTLSQRRDE